MKKILLVIFAIVNAVAVLGFPSHSDPGSGGVMVPLDGGLLLALLVGGTAAALFLKKDKNKRS